MSIKMTVVDIIYVDYDSALKFKLLFYFEKIQYGRQIWSILIPLIPVFFHLYITKIDRVTAV